MSIGVSRIATDCAGVDRRVVREIQGRVIRSPSPASRVCRISRNDNATFRLEER